MTALSRVQCDLRGRTGLGGLPIFADEKSVEIEVPRMRWLMLNQNPASSKKFNSYLAEALTLYALRAKICDLDINCTPTAIAYASHHDCTL